MKKPIVLLAILVAVLAFAVWQVAFAGGHDFSSAPHRSEAGPTASATSGTVSPGNGGGLQRSELAPREGDGPPPGDARATAGTLKDVSGEPAGDIEYWVWGEQRPGWARPRSEAGHNPTERHLGEAHGRTDAQGRWIVPEQITQPAAVTFSISTDTVVSYELTGGLDLVLPETGEIGSWLEGAGPQDEWTILYTPAWIEIEDGEVDFNCATHVAYPVATVSGPAVVSVEQRKWTGQGDQTSRWIGVLGLHVQVNAWGEAFWVEPEISYQTAPATLHHRVSQRDPVLEIELVDVTGSPAATGGIASCFRADGRIGSHERLQDGKASLSDVLEKGQRYRGSVLTDDGELFEREFDFAGAQTTPMRFVRDQGSKPLHLPLGREVDVDEVAMIVLGGPVGPVFAAHPKYLLSFDRGDAAYGRVDQQTFWLQDCGLAWLNAHVLLRDGRVASLNRPQPTADVGVNVEWLQTVELQPVSLGELERGDRGQFEFRLAIPRGAGEPTWVTLQSMQYDAYTSQWPTWELVAPIGYDRHLRHRCVGHSDVVIPLRER